MSIESAIYVLLCRWSWPNANFLYWLIANLTAVLLIWFRWLWMDREHELLWTSHVQRNSMNAWRNSASFTHHLVFPTVLLDLCLPTLYFI